MVLTWTDWPTGVLEKLRQGTVIPAHLLALDSGRRLDVRRQRALSRYYIDGGAGGLAVGVHSTQFAIREAGLYEEVLRLAVESAADWAKQPLFTRIQCAVELDRVNDLLPVAAEVTDCNAAFFDVANNFRGCIAGCHEVLRRQGLFEGIWCHDPTEALSTGQADAIERVMLLYPELGDDAFVAANRERWLP